MKGNGQAGQRHMKKAPGRTQHAGTMGRGGGSAPPHKGTMGTGKGGAGGAKGTMGSKGKSY